METLTTPDVLGIATHRYRIQKGYRVLVLMSARSFFVPIQTIEDDIVLLPAPVVSFEDFAARFPDYDCKTKAVTCFQWDKEGQQHEVQLALWDFIYQTYHTDDAPYFTEDIQKMNQAAIEETLLNIIDSRY